MKARYRRFDGANGIFNYPVVDVEGHESSGGFILLGYDSYEEAHNENPSAAIADVVEFHIEEESKVEVGFGTRPN